MAKFKEKDYQGPKSICLCGHTGDGEGSEHYDLIVGSIQNGMGICTIPKCDCEKFIFGRPTKKYRHFTESK